MTAIETFYSYSAYNDQIKLFIPEEQEQVFVDESIISVSFHSDLGNIEHKQRISVKLFLGRMKKAKVKRQSFLLERFIFHVKIDNASHDDKSFLYAIFSNVKIFISDQDLSLLFF